MRFSTAQTLAKTIAELAPELGSTLKGSAWCLKALHPSDASVEVGGLPDKSAVPSVMINYQSTARLGAPEGTTSPTWNFAATMLPHPVAFGVATHVSDDGTAVGDFQAFLNQQIEGATHVAKIRSFLSQVERWRLAYMGVSIHFDGPALSNQGSINVSQVPYAPREYHVSYQRSAEPYNHFALATVCSNDVAPADLPSAPEFPNYDRAISMPNAYVGEIKEGAYIPLKLTKTCQQWRSRSDLRFWTQPSPDTASSLTNGGLPVPVAATEMSYPFFGLPALALDATNTGHVGEATSPLCNDIVAHVCGRNIAVASGLVFTFRVGFEAQVEQGTTLSPYQKLSPEYDPVALKAYFLVARQLKDAYPVSYNDLGRLWDVISGGLEMAAPVLSVVHPGLGAAASGIRAVGNSIRSMSKAPKKDGRGSVTSAAMIQQKEDAMKKAIERKMLQVRAAQGRRIIASVPRPGQAPRKKK